MSLPRVTEVLQAAGLVDTTWYTEEAQERGTRLHKSIAKHLAGDVPDVGDDIAGQFGAYLRWRKEMKPKILEAECTVEGDGYVGHPDLLCVIDQKNGKWVIDFKSSLVGTTWHGVQLAAYAWAYKRCSKEAVKKVPRRANLYLSKDGRYKFVEHKNPLDWARFQDALQQWRTQQCQK